jgi:hypothetical protein
VAVHAALDSSVADASQDASEPAPLSAVLASSKLPQTPTGSSTGGRGRSVQRRAHSSSAVDWLYSCQVRHTGDER